jgi:hypothetical protein
MCSQSSTTVINTTVHRDTDRANINSWSLPLLAEE